MTVLLATRARMADLFVPGPSDAGLRECQVASAELGVSEAALRAAESLLRVVNDVTNLVPFLRAVTRASAVVDAARSSTEVARAAVTAAAERARLAAEGARELAERTAERESPGAGGGDVHDGAGCARRAGVRGEEVAALRARLLAAGARLQEARGALAALTAAHERLGCPAGEPARRLHAATVAVAAASAYEALCIERRDEASPGDLARLERGVASVDAALEHASGGMHTTSQAAASAKTRAEEMLGELHTLQRDAADATRANADDGAPRDAASTACEELNALVASALTLGETTAMAANPPDAALLGLRGAVDGVRRACAEADRLLRARTVKAEQMRLLASLVDAESRTRAAAAVVADVAAALFSERKTHAAEALRGVEAAFAAAERASSHMSAAATAVMEAPDVKEARFADTAPTGPHSLTDRSRDRMNELIRGVPALESAVDATRRELRGFTESHARGARAALSASVMASRTTLATAREALAAARRAHAGVASELRVPRTVAAVDAAGAAVAAADTLEGLVASGDMPEAADALGSRFVAAAGAARAAVEEAVARTDTDTAKQAQTIAALRSDADARLVTIDARLRTLQAAAAAGGGGDPDMAAVGKLATSVDRTKALQRSAGAAGATLQAVQVYADGVSAAATVAEETAAALTARALAAQRAMMERMASCVARTAKLQAAVESVERMLKKTSKMLSEVPPHVTEEHDKLVAAVNDVHARRRRAERHPEVAALLGDTSGRLLPLSEAARRLVEEYTASVAPAETVAASVEAMLTNWCAWAVPTRRAACARCVRV